MITETVSGPDGWFWIEFVSWLLVIFPKPFVGILYVL